MLTDSQIEIGRKIEDAAHAAGSAEIAYVSEWLGELPYGVYQWVECRNKSISNDFPDGWMRAGLAALEQHGFLKLISEWQDPSDEFHSKTTYQVTAKLQAA